jgi:hypothetical protein
MNTDNDKPISKINAPLKFNKTSHYVLFLLGLTISTVAAGIVGLIIYFGGIVLYRAYKDINNDR